MRVFYGTQLAGNPSTELEMKCAAGMINDLVKPSHFYNNLRNPSYAIRKPFLYPKAYRWVDENTDELDPVSSAFNVDTDVNIPSQKLSDKEQADVLSSSQHSVSQHTSQQVKSMPVQAADDGSSRKRSIGRKAAKNAKNRKLEENIEAEGVKEAFDAWKYSFDEENFASLLASKEEARE